MIQVVVHSQAHDIFTTADTFLSEHAAKDAAGELFAERLAVLLA